jgi:hypothetical protein
MVLLVDKVDSTSKAIKVLWPRSSMRTGFARLPLHYGSCPSWLFKRMRPMAGAIAEWIVLEYDKEELLKRISNPFFFQALGCVIGFDWHSSGLTTTVCGALKEALNEANLGIQVCGGKGAASRKTPAEIAETKFNLSTGKIEELQYTSRLVAKVDNNCVQDGFQLYHHNFFLAENGKWAVVQQGMDERWARRYHWFSDAVKRITVEPHTAICSDQVKERILDLTSHKSLETQRVVVDLVNDGPEHIKSLTMPLREEIRDVDISERGMKIIRMAYEAQPENFEKLIALPGLGPKTLRALTLVSDLVYGTEASWEDPVKYSFAHGGKDGYPYPVDRQMYDQNINLLKDAVGQAKLGDKEKLGALKRLSDYGV